MYTGSWETQNTNDFIDIFDVFGLEMQNTNEFIDIFDILGSGGLNSFDRPLLA